jgi:hypothetical protein
LKKVAVGIADTFINGIVQAFPAPALRVVFIEKEFIR